ncbi:MAG: hypothetical protein IPN90_10140 [Elusimicrobia bacterium]|nr:hypothetical protein [Elusimicrobiota bacterium]
MDGRAAIPRTVELIPLNCGMAFVFSAGHRSQEEAPIKTRPWSGPLVVLVDFSATSIEPLRLGILLASHWRRKRVLVPNQ